MLGAYAYLGPKATRAIFQLPSEKADILIGAVTVVTGVFGTITGGEHLCNGRHHLRVDVPYCCVDSPILVAEPTLVLRLSPPSYISR